MFIEDGLCCVVVWWAVGDVFIKLDGGGGHAYV